MTTAEVIGVAISLISLLGALVAFLSKRSEAADGRAREAEDRLIAEQIGHLSARVDEHHADVIARMDRADAASSKLASMVQMVPLLDLRVKSLEDWRAEGRR